MSALEKMCEAYWNAFRAGFAKVGGRAQDYPKWESGPPDVKEETMRCMRWAVETLKADFDATKVGTPLFDDLFPDQPRKRLAPRTLNDEVMASKLK